ncbi:MAG TPA: CinA family nicotinamide mononucleotide deamidase-related protein [Chitinophagales bacterium]|nr:CinA family nicotinamide mononucleotide deamidase-related protein [Chitinophagales bacterium]
MKAIIISIGDELLIGNTLNTNAHWLGIELTQLGIQVTASWTIPDIKSIIIEYIKAAQEQASIILITGGLGPTNDDLTVDAINSYYNQELVYHNYIWENIKEMYISRNRAIHEPSIKLAYLPKNAIPIFNTQGTAPGSLYLSESTLMVSMPGVPYEMKKMMELTVIPAIKEKFALPFIVNKYIYTAGVGETILSDALVDFEKNLPENFSLAYLPSVGKVRLRLTTRGNDLETLENTANELLEEALAAIQPYVYSTTELSFETVIGEMLRARNLKLGTAESCTGGAISQTITSIPGASDYYNGSIVSYSNEIKKDLLGIKSETIENHGAVSEETVQEMLKGALKQLNVDIAIAVSGVAGPGGGSPEKPVGCVYIGIANQNKNYIKRLQFTQNRERNIQLSTITALVMLKKFLLEEYPIN